MENKTIVELLQGAVHFYPRNESYVIPGTYDVELVDAVWILVGVLTIFTMQTGYGLVEAGTLSKRNRANVMMGNIIDIAFGAIIFYAFGFGVGFGRGEYTNGFFGAGDFFVNLPVNDPLMPQLLICYFINVAYGTSAASIFSAATAERVKTTAYIFLSMGVTMIYSVSASWIWGDHGFLKNIGVVDLAGAGPIHTTGGCAALVGAWYIKPRIGRYDKGTKPVPLSDPFIACAGMYILWWGWLGFNAGSSYGVTNGKFQVAARAGVGTFLASSSAGVIAFIISMIRNNGKADVQDVLFSIMSGLVTINAGCYLFSTHSSIIVGAISTVLYMIAAPIVDKLKIDDACSCIAIHLVNGIWGHLSVGFFGDPIEGPKSLFINGSLYRLKVQAFSVLCVCVWSCTATYILLKIVDWTIGIRMSEEEELGISSETAIVSQPPPLPVIFKNSDHSFDSFNKFVNFDSLPRNFNGSVSLRQRLDSDNLGPRKNYSINEGFERD